MVFSTAMISLGISIATYAATCEDSAVAIYAVGLILYFAGLICGFVAEEKLKSKIKKLEEK